MGTTADTTSTTDLLPFRVIELGRLLERLLHQRLADHDVTAAQLMVLTSIAMAPKSSRADLARRLQITPQAVGGITTQLTTKGLISRTTFSPGLPTDFALTSLGLDLVDNALPLVQDLAQDMLRFFRPNLAGAVDGALRHILVRLPESRG